MRQTDLLRASAEGKFSYKKQKAKSCTKDIPFYKNFPLPDSHLNSHLSNLSFLRDS